MSFPEQKPDELIHTASCERLELPAPIFVFEYQRPVGQSLIDCRNLEHGNSIPRFSPLKMPSHTALMVGYFCKSISPTHDGRRRVPSLFLPTMSQPLFSFEERIGLLFTVEGASLSICAVTVILCYALYKWVLTWRQSEFKDSEASDSILFLNLMLADLLQGIGTMPNIRWMNDGNVTEGKLCTTQAAVKQVGINGVALTSLAIALYSFFVLALRTDRTVPKHTSKVIVAGIWIFVALLVGIPNAVHRNGKYYGATQFWCWILPTYQVEQIVTEYLWVWFAALFMLLLYPIMFLLVRGWIGKKKAAGHVQTVHELHSIGQRIAEEAERTKKVAQKLLYYPLIYIVCILPNSISRWLSFKGHHPSPKFIFAANTLFALSGLFNFILFFVTRRSWVVGDRKRGERSQQLGRPTGKHGLPPPESSLHTSDPESPSGTIQSPDGVYSSTVVLSPKSHVSRSLPRERSTTAGYDDESYGYLPGH